MLGAVCLRRLFGVATFLFPLSIHAQTKIDNCTYETFELGSGIGETRIHHGDIAGWFHGTQGRQGFIRIGYSGKFEFFDVPNDYSLEVMQLSGSRFTLGTIGDRKHPYRIFVREPGGNISYYLKPDDSSLMVTSRTYRGAIVGSILRRDRPLGGFIFEADGDRQFRSFYAPQWKNPVQLDYTISNNEGDVAGLASSEDSNQPIMGYFRDKETQWLTLFELPDAGGRQKQWNRNTAVAINDPGTIAGVYTDKFGKRQEFVRSASGTITRYPAGDYVQIVSINNSGDVLFFNDLVDEPSSSYVRHSNGDLTRIIVPSSWKWVQVRGMDEDGAITGTYRVGGGSLAFLRTCK